MKALSGPLFGLFVGAIALSLLALIFGENPLTVFAVLYHSVFGSLYDLGTTLYGAVPLIFTGLAVALPLRAGLFNVGAEGQLLMGAIFSYSVLKWLPPLSSFVIAPISVLAALVGGGVWGFVAGWLKSRRNAHEVVVTIMLNYISFAILGWAVNGPWKNHESSMAETVTYSQEFRRVAFDFFEGAPLGWELAFAMGAALFLSYVLNKTLWGFHLKAWGQNPHAASLGGVGGRQHTLWALALGGALAGVAVWTTVASEGSLNLVLSNQFGFMGIAVAMLARGNPLGVVPSALLFSILNKGGAEFDLEFKYLSHDAVLIVQGIIILAVGANYIYVTKKLGGFMKSATGPKNA